MAIAPRHDLSNVLSACTFELAEQDASPEQSDKRICIPHREGNGETNIPNCEDRQRIRNCPQRTCQKSPYDQILLFCEVCEDVTRAL